MCFGAVMFFGWKCVWVSGLCFRAGCVSWGAVCIEAGVCVAALSLRCGGSVCLGGSVCRGRIVF